jgi:hypothetical protein
MKSLKDLLIELHACQIAIRWAADKKIEYVVTDCHRGDWLLWLAKKIDVDFKLLTLAKGHCAATVIHLLKDERSKKAIQAAIDFGNGLIHENDLKSAAADATDAAYSCAAADAYADAAAYAAADAYADAAAAAYAAADAYADAAAAAYAAADAYAAAADAAAAAKKENQMNTANICREIIGNEIIKIINEKLCLG